eukprot:2900858-Amphidinium_carterae.1
MSLRQTSQVTVSQDTQVSPQVDTALKALGDDDVDLLAKEELEMKKACIAASRALQPKKMEVAAMTEMSKNLQLLMLQ